MFIDAASSAATATNIKHQQLKPVGLIAFTITSLTHLRAHQIN